jgi:SNF2 family DNA or RNA helicase
MIRRTKENTLKDELPNKRDNIVFCQMSEVGNNSNIYE